MDRLVGEGGRGLDSMRGGNEWERCCSSSGDNDCGVSGEGNMKDFTKGW